MASVHTRPPLVTVIGATGTGKSNVSSSPRVMSHVFFSSLLTDFWSKLAVDIALALNGEIINGDAMQMYEGLPIITNKITKEEMCGVPHHLLGFLDVKDVWRVGKFVREAARIVSCIPGF